MPAMSFPRKLGNFVRDCRANALPIFVLAAIPIVYLTGMGVDYSLAARKQAKLNALADAAALAALTPTLMNQTDTQAKAAAANIFNAQATTMASLNYNPTQNLQINVVDSATTRTVTVSYTATSQNMFPGVLKLQGINLAGSSTATTTRAPNINFYLLLDNSPSMAIAASSDGINTMVANTQAQGGGCAFACHETAPQLENPALGNKNLSGKVDPTVDNYQLAQNLGVVTRIANLRTATQNLMTTAQQESQALSTTYQMAIYTFNNGFNTISALTSNLTQAQQLAGSIDVLPVYTNNFLTQTNKNSDTDTNYDNAMSNINSTMPTPGTGLMGDAPQEWLFFVTDGVEDEMVNGSRQQSIMDTSWCTTIKNRGIKIAVIYTTYLPLPTNSWYNTWIAPFQDQIGPNMQSCASPGFFFEVSTDQDISSALTQLFEMAVQTAYLEK
jgi:Flp pilus assembly protein TadG